MWEVKHYTDLYLDEMIEMTIEYYGKDNDISNKDFIIHEYFANPIGDAIIELAYDEEHMTIAGQYVITPQLFKVGNDNVRAVESLNTLTKEAYRGQGIFTKLAKSSYEVAKNNNYGFCYGAPNPNSFPGFIKKLEFIKLLDMPLYVKPLKPSKIVSEKTNKFLGFLCGVFNIFTLQKNIKDVDIVELTPNNVNLMDAFWEDVKDKYHIIGVRDSKYISYRYLNVPVRKYYPYIYVVNEKPVAFCVGRIRTVSDMTTGMLADLLFLDGYKKEAIKLVKFLTKKMKTLGAGLSGCIMLDHCNETSVLKKTGFMKCPKKMLPQPTPLIVRVFDDELKKKGVFETKNWFFTTGDYDVV